VSVTGPSRSGRRRGSKSAAALTGHPFANARDVAAAGGAATVAAAVVVAAVLDIAGVVLVVAVVVAGVVVSATVVTVALVTVVVVLSVDVGLVTDVVVVGGSATAEAVMKPHNATTAAQASEPRPLIASVIPVRRAGKRRRLPPSRVVPA
jgi:hypothetical protein